MEENREGFIYPVIDEARCIDCRVCTMRCPYNDENIVAERTAQAYALRSRNRELVKASSSGGAFTAIAQAFHDGDCYIFGAGFNESLQVRHDYAINDTSTFRKSKYVQSTTGRSFVQVKNLLTDGFKVLFSGTPCQVAGLKSFLEKEHDNLLSIEVICHGVANQKFFGAYISFLEKKYRAKLVSYEFRSKEKSGWKNSNIVARFSDEKRYTARCHTVDDPFMNAYLRRLSTRPSCNSCRFAGPRRYADFTIGDFWGSGRIVPVMDDNRGVSLVLANTFKAESVMSRIGTYATIEKAEFDRVVGFNPLLVRKPTEQPLRDAFMNSFAELGFEYVKKCYLKPRPLIVRMTGRVFGPSVKMFLRKTVFYFYFMKTRRKTCSNGTASIPDAKPVVGIVTLHNVRNFGSVLQAYCTCLAFEKAGCRPKIINYLRPHYALVPSLLTIFRKEMTEGTGRHFMMKHVVIILKIVSFLLQGSNFHRFVSTYLPVTGPKCTTFEALRRLPPPADIYCTGSDQVWNSFYNKGIDRTYFLDFAPPGKPRISFAASFGDTQLNNEEKPEIRKLLKKYVALSVREQSGVEIIDSLGISGACNVLDPTLMLTRDEWARKLEITRPEERNYLVIYSVERSIDTVVNGVAATVGEALKIPVIYITTAGRLSSMRQCDTQRVFLRVEEILGYLYHADYIIASSFHGTAFAVNFNRPFASVLPPAFGGRIKSLLDLTGLSHRIVENRIEPAKILSAIDFSKVNEALDRERAITMAYLKKSVGKAKNFLARQTDFTTGVPV